MTATYVIVNLLLLIIGILILSLEINLLYQVFIQGATKTVLLPALCLKMVSYRVSQKVLTSSCTFSAKLFLPTPICFKILTDVFLWSFHNSPDVSIIPEIKFIMCFSIIRFIHMSVAIGIPLLPPT